MPTPYIGEIKLFAGTFEPRSWAFCNGQLLPISTNTALFALLGTIYGGDGATTFGLPDLRGRIPIHQGHGPGLSSRTMGSRSGAEKVTLNVDQLPGHSHTIHSSDENASTPDPEGNILAQTAAGDQYTAKTGSLTLMNSSTSSSVGGSQSHNNLMPFQCIHFIIALSGLFPARN